MPQLVIPKTYRAQRAPRTQDLDNFRLTMESFVNSTKLDEDNLQVDALLQALTATQASQIIDNAGIGDVGASLSEVTVTTSGLYLIQISDTSQNQTGTSTAIPGVSAILQTSLVINFSTIRSWSVTINVGSNTSEWLQLQTGVSTHQTLVRALTAGDVVTVTRTNSLTSPPSTLFLYSPTVNLILLRAT